MLYLDTKFILWYSLVLTLDLVKSQDIPEAIGAAQACVTFSNPFARSFEISPSVGRPPNSSAIAIGNKSDTAWL